VRVRTELNEPGAGRRPWNWMEGRVSAEQAMENRITSDIQTRVGEKGDVETGRSDPPRADERVGTTRSTLHRWHRQRVGRKRRDGNATLTVTRW
jgi:hypothetical protein